MTAPRICARCSQPLVQHHREPTLDFRRRRTCGTDACRWRGKRQEPRVRGEWPAWMALHRPFAAQDRDPGDGSVVRMLGREPSLGGGNSSLGE